MMADIEHQIPCIDIEIKRINSGFLELLLEGAEEHTPYCLTSYQHMAYTVMLLCRKGYMEWAHCTFSGQDWRELRFRMFNYLDAEVNATAESK